jgi:hypothetical protein
MRQLRGDERRRQRALLRLRDLATLKHGQVVGLALATFLLQVALLAGPGGALGADPTSDPSATSRPATCAERFPAEGPAGVDLRLGCIVGEVIGSYTATNSALPTPISTYAVTLIAVIGGAALLVFVAVRLVRRRAGRRLAPTLSAEWWVCATCKSVNGTASARCYSCGSAQTEGPMLTTDADPEISQSFGSTRKRG